MKTFRPHQTLLTLALGVTFGLTLSGCANVNTKTAENTPGSNTRSPTETSKTVIPPYKGGGYYKNDGPGANPPDNLETIPDAVPKRESLHRYANDAYKVLGHRYIPLAENTEYKERGLASWYGRKFHGNSTSTGEPYDMYAMSAAHATLPLPSYARVTNLENGKSVVVRVNDRGPFHAGRIIDLSYTAAYKLDILKGVTHVEVEAINTDSAPTSFAAQAKEDIIAAAPTSVTQPEAPASKPAKAFYLQLGAFSNPATADGVMARVSEKLSKDFPGVMRLEINGLHKVQAGPFANNNEADRAATLVQQDLGIKAFKVLVDAPAAPASPAITAAVVPGLYLQLAAVSTQASAETLATRVKSRFGDELPGLNQINSGNLFKLQAGPFATPAAAERIAQAYQQDFGVRPYRITR